MSTPSERLERAEDLLAHAHQLEASPTGEPRGGGRHSRRRGRARATALLCNVERELDRLRELGYRELPDGRWLNPAGEIVQGGGRQ